MSETADRLYEALIRYERQAAGLGPQTNSGPPPPGWAQADPIEHASEAPPAGVAPDTGALS